MLDTHVFYWVVLDSPRLPTRHRDLLARTTKDVFVSAMSGWEIATKVRIGRWPEAAPLLPHLQKAVDDAGLASLPLSIAQAERGGSIEHDHKDPFDRLLAAQALDLGLTIMTVDPAFHKLGCAVY